MRTGAVVRGTTYRLSERRRQSAASLKETFHFPFQVRERSFHHFPARIDDDRPLWTQRIEMQADGLPDPSLDAIAHHRLAQRPRRSEADSGPAGRRLPDAESREKRPAETGTLIIDSTEIRGSQQTNTFRKTRDALPLGADRQFVAAPSAAPRQDGPPVLGFHA